jgi:hypothetical protein
MNLSVTVRLAVAVPCKPGKGSGLEKKDAREGVFFDQDSGEGYLPSLFLNSSLSMGTTLKRSPTTP